VYRTGHANKPDGLARSDQGHRARERMEATDFEI
jgi:hypothetical protein